MTNATIQENADRATIQAICQQSVVFANIIELTVGVTRAMNASQMQGAIGEKTLARAVMANMVSNHIKKRLTAAVTAR